MSEEWFEGYLRNLEYAIDQAKDKQGLSVQDCCMIGIFRAVIEFSDLPRIFGNIENRIEQIADLIEKESLKNI